MITVLQLRAMRAVFEKIAEGEVQTPTVRSFAALQKRLKPGDIIISSPKRGKPSSSIISRGVGALLGGISKKIQGEYTHSAVYTGRGGVTEIRLGESAGTKPLREALMGLDVKVVRPLVTPRKRQQALKMLKKMVDDGAQYDQRQLFVTGAANFVKLKGKTLRSRIEANKFICSNLITHAYKGVQFDRNKDPEMVIPVDFIKSHIVRPIITFTNPGRRNR